MHVRDIFVLGIRAFFDPFHCTHGEIRCDASGYPSVSSLETEPPLYVGAPVVMVVVGSTAFLMHKPLALSVPLLLALMEKKSHPTIRAWNQRVPVLSVAPPASGAFASYLTAHVFGCECSACCRALQSESVRQLVDYMHGGATSS